MKLVVLSAAMLLGMLEAKAAGEGNVPPGALDVWKASGGENWDKVKEVQFTFEVEADGKILVSAKHIWNVRAGTDEVTWKDKHVTVDVNAPATDDADAKAAYARWVNDSYWLLAPLKIMDRGVNLTAEASKEEGGTTCDTLRLSFGQVGLTPADQYLLYVDPKTKLLRAWDYTPKEGSGMHATWEKYESFGPLKLSTEHHFNGKTIRFTGVQVLTDS